MGLFKRANFHSGLTYKQTCPLCNTTVIYKDDKLDFRPWYADGFVYCPTCKKPLRHRESYALDSVAGKEVDLTKPTNKFCASCGEELRDGAGYCTKCGNKCEE